MINIPNKPYAITKVEKLRLLLAQFLARLVVLALPPRFRPDPPLPKLKKSLVQSATQPVPDRQIESLKNPFVRRTFQEDQLTKSQKSVIEKIMKGKRTYEQQKEDADQLMRDLAKKE